MKKILITGANSYIGTSFEEYIKENYSKDYQVDTVDMVGDGWREKSFSGYDSIFHVAGIAHKKENKENAQLYYEINRDLAIETAKKAKKDGVKQFIFLSSMSVYGMDVGVITKETLAKPKSHYGKSKLQAEVEIVKFQNEHFDVCILRPPMVYGKGCKGNFQKILKIAKKCPVFPNIKNKRSMIYIDNLCAFVKMCVRDNLAGVFFPQNREYVSTIDMVRKIAAVLNRKIFFGYLTGFAVYLMRLLVPVAKKGFGTLIYKDTEDFGFSYVIVENDQSFEFSAL